MSSEEPENSAQASYEELENSARLAALDALCQSLTTAASSQDLATVEAAVLSAEANVELHVADLAEGTPLGVALAAARGQMRLLQQEREREEREEQEREREERRRRYEREEELRKEQAAERKKAAAERKKKERAGGARAAGTRDHTRGQATTTAL